MKKSKNAKSPKISQVLGFTRKILDGSAPLTVINHLTTTTTTTTTTVLSLPTLDDLAPQMVEQLPDILQFFRALSPDLA